MAIRACVVAWSMLLGSFAAGCATSNEIDTAGQGGTGGATTATGGDTTATGGVAGGTGGTGGTGGVPIVCGDGAIDEGEQCDDGNSTPDDGCSSSCQIEPGYTCSGEPSKCKALCSNGMLDGTEECDDANASEGDGCDADCLVEEGWECKDTGGIPVSMCHLSCGDGTLDAAEACDVGPDMPDDGCAPDCAADMGYVCTNPDGPDKPSACATVCGDGIVAGDEVCDDADTTSGNGCESDCLAATLGWKCDTIGGASSCMPVCGDGLAVGGEICDDGNNQPGDGCDPGCSLEATCGNMVIEPGEECDGGVGCAACKLDNAPGACGELVDTAVVGVKGVEGTATTTTVDGTTTGATHVFGDPGDYGIPACSAAAIHETRVHKHVTGANGAFVRVQALAGNGNFTKTAVWASLDCLAATIDGCNSGTSVTLTLGYVPAKTTLYIAIADNGTDADNGTYSLKITEQPVKLFLYETFETGLGQFTPSDTGNDGFTWFSCDPDMGACPQPNTTFSRSRGAFALASDDPDHNLSLETISTGLFTVGPVTTLYFQYNYEFRDQPLGNDGFAVQDSGDGVTWKDIFAFKNFNLGGRRVQNVSADPVGSILAVRFRYDDSMLDSQFAAVDDVFVYGY